MKKKREQERVIEEAQPKIVKQGVNFLALRRQHLDDDEEVRVETEPAPVDDHLQNSMPNDEEVENFADFFMRGSDNLKRFAAEFDDIGN